MPSSPCGAIPGGGGGKNIGAKNGCPPGIENIAMGGGGPIKNGGGGGGGIMRDPEG